jgi:hypothetical protein
LNLRGLSFLLGLPRTHSVKALWWPSRVEGAIVQKTGRLERHIEREQKFAAIPFVVNHNTKNEQLCSYSGHSSIGINNLEGSTQK